MTALPILQPWTSGGRPPVDPPKRTTFDSSSGNDDDPIYDVYADSVKFLLKHLKSAEPRQYPIYLDLIRARKKSIEVELSAERLLGFDELPPLLLNMYTLDALFEENEAIRVFRNLLDQLNEAEQSLLSKMCDLNMEPPASEL